MRHSLPRLLPHHSSSSSLTPPPLRFFGLVTSAGTGASCSSSCHVFMVEAVAVEGEVQARAPTFHFTPTPAPGGGYLEFPTDADPILGVLYALRGGEGEGQVGQVKAPPSTTFAFESAAVTSTSRSSFTSLMPSCTSCTSCTPGSPRALQHLLGAQQLGLWDRREGGRAAGAAGGRVALVVALVVVVVLFIEKP